MMFDHQRVCPNPVSQGGTPHLRLWSEYSPGSSPNAWIMMVNALVSMHMVTSEVHVMPSCVMVTWVAWYCQYGKQGGSAYALDIHGPLDDY